MSYTICASTIPEITTITSASSRCFAPRAVGHVGNDGVDPLQIGKGRRRGRDEEGLDRDLPRPKRRYAGACCSDKPHGGNPHSETRTAARLRRRREPPYGTARFCPRRWTMEHFAHEPLPAVLEKLTEQSMMLQRQNLKCKGFGK
jgi:hypothetical protein